MESLGTLPRDTGPALLYVGAVRHLAGRVTRWGAVRLLRAADRVNPRHSPREAAGAVPAVLAAERTRSLGRHPSSFPVHDVPGGIVINLMPRLGHGASEGDPDL